MASHYMIPCKSDSRTYWGSFLTNRLGQVQPCRVKQLVRQPSPHAGHNRNLQGATAGTGQHTPATQQHKLWPGDYIGCQEIMIGSGNGFSFYTHLWWPVGHHNEGWGLVTCSAPSHYLYGIEIQQLSYKKMNLKVASAKWHPFCLSLN